jgi:hypothetical protein
MRLLPRHRLHELHKSLLPRHIIDFFELWIDRRWPKIPVSIEVESKSQFGKARLGTLLISLDQGSPSLHSVTESFRGNQEFS